jgi:hypothetical protein
LEPRFSEAKKPVYAFEFLNQPELQGNCKGFLVGDAVVDNLASKAYSKVTNRNCMSLCVCVSEDKIGKLSLAKIGIFQIKFLFSKLDRLHTNPLNVQMNYQPN